MVATNDIYVDASNNAANQAANAAALFNQAVAPIYELLKAKDDRRTGPYGKDIPLPPWNYNLIQNEGRVSVADPGEFTDKYVPPSVGIPVAPDIAKIVNDAYNNANPVSQAAIDAAINSWLALYAPDYMVAIRGLQTAVDAGLNGGTALSDDVEQRIYNRMTLRIAAENQSVQAQVTTAMRRRGYQLPQIVLSAALAQASNQAADRNAQAATETAIKRAELEIDFKKFCMSTSTQIQQMVQSAMLQYAELIANLKKFAIDYAIKIGEMNERAYEAQVKMFMTALEAALKQFQALVEVNNAKLSAYKARLEGELEKRKLEYGRMEMQVRAAQIPYEGELRANLEEARLAVTSLHAAVNAAAQAHAASSSIAQSAMAGLNAIANVTAQE